MRLDINQRPRSPQSQKSRWRGAWGLLSGAIWRHTNEAKMSDKIMLELTPKELDVLKEHLEGSDSDAPEITTILDRLNDLTLTHGASTQS
jgi:hypothetical protein